MSSRWFRFYDEALNDPKVQCLPGEDFKAWVNMLALASKHGGKLPELAGIAFALRIDAYGCEAVIKRLQSAGLLDTRCGGTNGSHYAPHGWDKRQYKSDGSTERVQRFRKRSKSVSETGPDTDTDTYTDTDTDKRKVSPLTTRDGLESDAVKLAAEAAHLAKAAAAEKVVAEAASAAAAHRSERESVAAEWNAMAAQKGLPLVSKLTDARKTRLDARLAENGRAAFSEAIRRVAASALCRGENDRGWKATFDFLLQPSSFLKLIEGNYDGDASGNRPVSRQNPHLDSARQRGSIGSTVTNVLARYEEAERAEAQPGRDWQDGDVVALEKFER